MTEQAEGSAEMMIRPSPARERWRRLMMLPYEPEVTIGVAEYDALKGQAAAVTLTRQGIDTYVEALAAEQKQRDSAVAQARAEGASSRELEIARSIVEFKDVTGFAVEWANDVLAAHMAADRLAERTEA